jgi:hypothetical protein
MFVLILRILASLFNIFMLITIIGWLNEKRSRERLISSVVLSVFFVINLVLTASGM